MSNDYEQAVENLYAAFSDIPRPLEMDGCPCCIKADEIATLLQKPLRELNADDLGAFAGSAPWTVGTWADYLYFFPRMFELSLRRGEMDFLHIPELILSRLDDAEARTLTQVQQDAIAEVLEAHWTYVLERDAEEVIRGGEYDADDILACLFIANIPPEPFLNRWLATRTPNALGQLAHFIRFNGADLQKGGVWNAFLDDEHSSYARAIERKAHACATMREWLQTHGGREQLQWLKTELERRGDMPHTLESAQIALEFLKNERKDSM